MKRWVQFAAVLAVVMGGGAWAITLLLPDAGVARAVWTSAAVAAAVQLLSFGILQVVPPEERFRGWGAGAELRVLALVVYAWAAMRMNLPMAVTLLSFVGFLFVTTLAEPFLLKP